MSFSHSELGTGIRSKEIRDDMENASKYEDDAVEWNEARRGWLSTYIEGEVREARNG